jgi:hypothetical protein
MSNLPVTGQVNCLGVADYRWLTDRPSIPDLIGTGRRDRRQVEFSHLNQMALNILSSVSVEAIADAIVKYTARGPWA